MPNGDHAFHACLVPSHELYAWGTYKKSAMKWGMGIKGKYRKSNIETYKLASLGSVSSRNAYVEGSSGVLTKEKSHLAIKHCIFGKILYS